MHFAAFHRFIFIHQLMPSFVGGFASGFQRVLIALLRLAAQTLTTLRRQQQCRRTADQRTDDCAAQKHQDFTHRLSPARMYGMIILQV